MQIPPAHVSTVKNTLLVNIVKDYTFTHFDLHAFHSSFDELYSTDDQPSVIVPICPEISSKLHEVAMFSLMQYGLKKTLF
ncbi:hypothetical protein GDO81_012103 [Engystomops pustulosus]|uniref:Uncharacterized protein n=1 Tax=Engystomops pustulosus TaxID=76066 RepID=A0AAV7BJR8_ENGPU|nr:hypothetical protein GDO81_012103 [Engystomops pustulosus]